MGTLQQFIRYTNTKRIWFQYALVGVSGVLVDMLLFVVLSVGFQMHPALATVISTSAGISNNFIWNARFTFKRQDHLWRRFFIFFAVGTSGILASAFSLILFADIFAFDSVWVKLLSIPPIVLAQFILNKKVSFGEMPPGLKHSMQFIRNNRGLIGLCGVFILLSALLVRFVPYTPGSIGGPDEWQHYGKNVQFLLEEHRLPISGQDDIDSLSTCRDNPYGQVPCLYSYQFTPSFNYIVAAISARLGELVGLEALTGARLASTIWGVVFITGIYMLSRLFLDKRWALGVAAIVASIPQIIFISSYVNQDIHSLAIATWLVYTTLGYLVYGRKRLRWMWYISFGLLLSAKYNYMLVALIPAGLLLWQWWQRRDTKVLLRHVVWLGGAALVISGGWYIRNWLLYHDVTGMNFVLQQMAEYHALGTKWSLTDVQSYLLIFKFDALNALFSSFFSQLGYLVVRLDESFYTLIKLTVLGGLAVLWLYGTRTSRRILAAAIAFLAVVMAAVIVNALTYDFQFQGRYVYAAIPVLVAAVAYALNTVRQKKPTLAQGLLVGTGVVMALVLVQSGLLLATHLVNFYG